MTTQPNPKRQKGVQRGKEEASGRQLIEQALAKHASNLWHEVRDDYGMFRRLTVTHRADGSILGVLSTEDEKGVRWVVFGQGESFVGVLVALSNAIAADNWKLDKLANGG